MAILEEISTFLQQGRAPKVKELVQQAIDEGIAPQTILEEGLLSGMNVVGEKFKNNEVFVPEVLVAARAMNMGVGVLKPYLVQAGVESKGTAVIGTVKGDLHDIGKNLVKMMLEGKGLTVIDLGVDVPGEFQLITGNDTKLAEVTRPMMTSITQPLYDIGAVSMRLLTKLMNGDQEESQEATTIEGSSIILNHGFVKRQTTY